MCLGGGIHCPSASSYENVTLVYCLVVSCVCYVNLSKCRTQANVSINTASRHFGMTEESWSRSIRTPTIADYLSLEV